MGKISREDMLELTRRMNLARNCFGRIAGAYLDDEGYVDGTFNIHFLKLSQAERTGHLARAKRILLAETNTELEEYRFSQDSKRPGSIRTLLSGLVDCELKNDALLDVFYEAAAEHYRSRGSYGILFLHGNYDIPRQGSDKVRQWESENVYRFLIGLFCPLEGEYAPGNPDFGFLYPAYKERAAAPDCINIFHAGSPKDGLRKFLLE